MTTNALRFIDVDTDTAIMDAAVSRVRRAFVQGSLAMIAGVGCVYLWRAQRSSTKVARKLSALEITTEDDRAQMLKIAKELSAMSESIEQARAGLTGRPLLGRSTVPFVGLFLRSLDRLCETVEDLAETAALAASKEFADLVGADLAAHFDHQQYRKALV